MSKKHKKVKKTASHDKTNHKNHESAVKKSSTPILGNVKANQTMVFVAIAFLVIGLLVGSMISYGALMAQPITSQNNGNPLTVTEEVDLVALQSQVEDYVNDNLLPEEEVIAVVNDINNLGDGLYSLEFEIFQDGQTVSGGTFFATKERLLLVSGVFELNAPFELSPPLEEEAPVEEEIDMQDLTEEEISQIASFNSCLAEKGITIYGADWCGYTQALVETLGGFSLVDPIYVECTQESELCNENQVTGYPTVMMNGEKISPERTMAGFADATGCTAPSLVEKVEAQPPAGSC